MAALTALANLGQINALQSVMLFTNLCKSMDKNEIAATMQKFNDIKPEERDLNEDILIFNHATSYSPKTSYFKNAEDDDFDMVLFKTLIARHKKDKTPLVRERYLKMVAGCNLGFHLVAAARLRAKLRKLTSENYSPANRYAYAKNLYFFGTNKQREFGLYMLKGLADRDYCEKTKQEMKYTTKHLQEHDFILNAQGILVEARNYDYGEIFRWL